MKKCTALLLAMLLLLLPAAYAEQAQTEDEKLRSAVHTLIDYLENEDTLPDADALQKKCDELGLSVACVFADDTVAASNIDSLVGFDYGALLPSLGIEGATGTPGEAGSESVVEVHAAPYLQNLRPLFATVAYGDGNYVCALSNGAVPQTSFVLTDPDARIISVDMTLVEADKLLDIFETMLSDDSPVSELTLTYAQTLTDALMMLQSGRSDLLVSFYDTSRYIAARTEGLTAHNSNLFVSLHMIANDENQDFVVSLNESLQALCDDGSMLALWYQWIDGVIEGNDPEAVKLPVIEGAPTYKIGISGDMPPLDYANAAGEASGFNVALLTALSEQLGVNFELVFLDSGSRTIALRSGLIDMFFWHSSAADDLSISQFGTEAEYDAAIDAFSNIPAGLIITDPYAVLSLGYVTKD